MMGKQAGERFFQKRIRRNKANKINSSIFSLIFLKRYYIDSQSQRFYSNTCVCCVHTLSVMFANAHNEGCGGCIMWDQGETQASTPLEVETSPTNERSHCRAGPFSSLCDSFLSSTQSREVESVKRKTIKQKDQQTP